MPEQPVHVFRLDLTRDEFLMVLAGVEILSAAVPVVAAFNGLVAPDPTTAKEKGLAFKRKLELLRQELEL